MELGDLCGLTHSLEIDSDDTALVVVGGHSVLLRWGAILAGWGTVLARRGTWVSSLGATRVLALLTQQDLADLLQEGGIYVLSLGGLGTVAHRLVLTARAEGGGGSAG